jgi:hypothetical protein
MKPHTHEPEDETPGRTTPPEPSYLLRVGDLDAHEKVITGEAAEALARQVPQLLTYDGVGLIPKPEAFGGMGAEQLRELLKMRMPEQTVLVIGGDDVPRFVDNSELLAERRRRRAAEEPDVALLDVRDMAASPTVQAATMRLAAAAGEDVPDNRLTRRDGSKIDVIYRSARAMREPFKGSRAGEAARRQRAGFRQLKNKEKKLVTQFLREIVRDTGRTPEEVEAAKAALQLPDFDERKKRALAIGAGGALAGLWAGAERRGAA